jgi:hypothetical protein
LFIGNSVLDNLTPFNLIIGNGFGNFNQAIFINSNVFILYSTGIVGMTIYLTFLARNYIHNNDIGRLTIIILIAISFAWYIVYSPFLIPFIVVIISEKQKRKFDIVRRY